MYYILESFPNSKKLEDCICIVSACEELYDANKDFKSIEEGKSKNRKFTLCKQTDKELKIIKELIK